MKTKKTPERQRSESRTLAERLESIEEKYDLSGPDVARLLMLDPRDYRKKYRNHDKEPTAWQRTALDMIDAHGIRTLQKRLKVVQ
jgi:hypothetical protein